MQEIEAAQNSGNKSPLVPQGPGKLGLLPEKIRLHFFILRPLKDTAITGFGAWKMRKGMG